jgi:uncharacterized protein with PIN domain
LKVITHAVIVSTSISIAPTPAYDGGVARLTVRVAEELRFFLPVGRRHGEVPVDFDTNTDTDTDTDTEAGTTLLHLVESLGVPRTEIGGLRVGDRVAGPDERPRDGDVVDVQPVPRPQRVADPRFVADVHLGTLARRMRLLGIDVAYRNDASDPDLAEQAASEGRILITKDRGLLRRRAVPVGAYVRGSRTADQLRDVLDRFDPPLAPWTRCPACNGRLEAVDADAVAHLLQPGTRRSYTRFSQCVDCGRPYWRGAHAQRLEEIVDAHLRRS